MLLNPQNNFAKKITLIRILVEPENMYLTSKVIQHPHIASCYTVGTGEKEA